MSAESLIGKVIKDQENNLMEMYLSYIGQAIEEIMAGTRPDIIVKTLSRGGFHLTHQSLKEGWGPEPLYVRVTNHPVHGNGYLPITMISSLKDFLEAANLYHQLKKQEASK